MKINYFNGGSIGNRNSSAFHSSLAKTSNITTSCPNPYAV